MIDIAKMSSQELLKELPQSIKQLDACRAGSMIFVQ